VQLFNDKDVHVVKRPLRLNKHILRATIMQAMHDIRTCAAVNIQHCNWISLEYRRSKVWRQLTTYICRSCWWGRSRCPNHRTLVRHTLLHRLCCTSYNENRTLYNRHHQQCSAPFRRNCESL